MKKGMILYICNKLVNTGLILFAIFSPVSITGAQVSFTIMLFPWIILMILKKQRIIYTPMNIPVIIFICASIISNIFSITPLISLKKLLPELIMLCLIYLIVVNHIKDTGMIKRLVIILVIMSTLNSVYGIWCYLTGMDIIHPLSSTRPTYEDTLRAQGTFNNPLTFAEYLLIILCLSVALIFSTEIKKLKFFFILSIFIIGFGILFSYTRSSWLGLFGAMIFISIIIGRKAYISIAIFLLLIGSISCSLDNTLIKRAKSIFEYSEQSQNVRLSIWCITLWMIKDYPVVGVGEGNYKKIFGEYKDELGINTKIWGEAHNTFLHVLATRGIIGLLAFLWLWIVFFRESILGYINIRDSFLRFLLLGALAGMIGIHIAGLFEHVFGDSEVAMLIWFIMGLVMSIIIHHKDKYYVLSTEDSQNKKLRL